MCTGPPLVNFEINTALCKVGGACEGSALTSESELSGLLGPSMFSLRLARWRNAPFGLETLGVFVLGLSARTFSQSPSSSGCLRVQ